VQVVKWGVILMLCFLTACSYPSNQVTSKTNSIKVVKEEKVPKILLDQLSKETQKDIAQITKEDLLSIENIDLSSSALTEIENKDIGFDFSLLSEMKNLKSLRIIDVKPINFNFLNNLGELKALSIAGNDCRNLPNLKQAKLTFLDLDNCKITDLNFLTNISNIEILWLKDNKISDLSPIAMMNKLNFLAVPNNPIKDISSIVNLTSLDRIIISDTQITDLSPLKNLTELTYLDIRSTNVTSVAPLVNLPKLKILLLDKDKIKDLNLLSQKKELKISEVTILDAD